MRILLGTDTFVPTANGIALHVYDLASELAERGHELTIIAPGSGVLEPVIPNCRIHRLPSRPTKYGDIVNFTSLLNVRRLTIECNPEICHIHTSAGVGLTVLYTAKRLRIPVVFTSHMRAENFMKFFPSIVPVSLAIRKAYWRVVGYVASHCSLAIVPGADAGLEFSRETGVEPHVISSGVGSWCHSRLAKVERESWEDELRILYVGRLDADKSVDVLLSAICIAQQGGAHMRLRLCGRGTLEGRLHSFATEMGIGNSVEFQGVRNRGELVREYEWADIVCLPGRFESLSRVAVEALACGTPLIVPWRGGSRELIQHSGWGFIFDDRGNVPAFNLAEVLTNVASNRELLSLCEPDRDQVIRSHSMKAVVDSLLLEYGRLITGEL
jgi:glycosyltransferase involved in cell wall biosynthesis